MLLSYKNCPHMDILPARTAGSNIHTELVPSTFSPFPFFFPVELSIGPFVFLTASCKCSACILSTNPYFFLFSFIQIQTHELIKKKNKKNFSVECNSRTNVEWLK